MKLEQIEGYGSGRAKGREMVKKQVEIHEAKKLLIKLEIDIAAIKKVHNEMSKTKELIQQLETELEVIQDTKIKGIER